MTPEKIYLTAKGAEKLASAPEGVETTRVKTYPSKTDIEYTDLSQVWHSVDELPGAYEDLLIRDKYGDYYVGYLSQEEGDFCGMRGIYIDHAKEWAYISHIDPSYKYR